MKRRLLPAILAAAALLSGTAALAEPVRTAEVEAELIAETTALQAGENWVALRMRPEPGWHVYWRNPGDSGIPTKLQWQLPPGVSAGEIHWPYPHPESLGELTNYGYSDETLHLVPITLSGGAPRGPLTLAAQASWLACKDICIPGKADLSLQLPRADDAPVNADWAHLFAKARRELPQPAQGWPAQFSVADG
ncbi:MAG: protein-disulfide reductase DsbD domain-containing protein, partial [Gammaproteobacteria bacterium]